MIKKLLTIIIAFSLLSCDVKEERIPKIDVYSWEGAPGDGLTKEALDIQMKNFKDKGLKGVFYNIGFNIEGLKLAAKAAQDAGLEFHTWIPTMLQGKNDILQKEWYGVSREGFNALDKPAFVQYYTFLCPNREEVYEYLSKKYLEVADIEGVDGIHLDYIRYPDAILARGLWNKYDLVMDTELAPYDYCYCDKCVADFKEISGIDIRAKGDDAQNIEEWDQFRYDVLTKFVNRLADEVHAKNKKISAAVFPGPSDAKNMVRQEWDKWNLDMVAPMLYNDFYLEKPEWVGEKTKEGIEATKGKNTFISGLFICPDPAGKSAQKDPEGHGLLPEELATAINSAMDNGADAISLFTSGRMTPEHWVEFDKVVFGE